MAFASTINYFIDKGYLVKISDYKYWLFADEKVFLVSIEDITEARPKTTIAHPTKNPTDL